MFKGSFTALITPFKNGKFDETSFRSLIDFQIDSGKSCVLLYFWQSRAREFCYTSARFGDSPAEPFANANKKQIKHE